MFTTQQPIKNPTITKEAGSAHERSVKTITDATPWQDLYFQEDYGRSRASAFAKNLHHKFDTDRCKEVPSVVYEDDTVDEQADSPGKHKEVSAQRPMAEASNDDNTEMAAMSGKIRCAG